MSPGLYGRTWRERLLLLIAGLGLVFVIVNIFLFSANRAIQGQVNDRQQFINQSVQLDRLNRELIAALASYAARNNDDQIRNLLASQGITITVNPSGGQAPAAPQSGPAAAPTGRTKSSR